MPAAGVATTGKTGTLAMQIGAGSVIYLPVAGFNPSISSGRDVIPLLNNEAYAVNEVNGVSLGSFDFAAPLVNSVLTAAVLTSLVNSVLADDGASNYFTLTFFPDKASAGVVYGRCKMGSFALQVSFSTSGVGSAVGLRFSGISLDPESTTVTALAAPGSSPVAAGGIKGYPQTAFTGATSVVSVGLQVGTGLAVVPGEVAGAGEYPYLAPSLLQTNLTGSLSLTQLRNAATTLGDGGFTMSIGTTGDGIAIATNSVFMSDSKPSSQSINYKTRRYMLKSSDGTTSPLLITAL